MQPIGKILFLLVAPALALAACGGGDDDVASSGDPTTTTTTTAAPESDVERIVSLSPTATEMLFAIGAGDQVTAVDDQSDYPPEAPMTDLSGFTPNVEAIAAHEPDLVVMANEVADVSDALDALDIVVLVQPAAVTLDDTYAQIDELGALTGHADEAEALVADIDDGIQEVTASLPDEVEGLTYYHELDSGLFTATSDTFIGGIYGLLGLRNIADGAGGGIEYPQLSAEHVLDADPDLIFLADTQCCDQSAATIAERPGWGELTAVQSGAVIELDDDVASRWGPRVVDFLRVIGDRLEELHGDGS